MAEPDDCIQSKDDDVMKLYEDLFKYRYTEDDPDYKDTINKPAIGPPCVTNWFVKQKRNDWGGRQENRNNNRSWGRDSHQGQSGSDGRGYRDRSYDDRNRDRGYDDRNRDRGYDNRQSYHRPDRGYRQDYHRR